MTVIRSAAWKEESSSVNEFHKLIKRLGILRKYVFWLLLRSPFDALRTWMTAAMMKSVFQCLQTSDQRTLPLLCIGYGLLCTLLFVYNGVVWSSYAAFAAKTQAMLQKKMIERLRNQPYGRLENRLTGEWLTRLNSDIEEACMMMNAPLRIPHAVVAVVNTLLSAYLMMRSSLLLTGIVCMCILPHLWLNYRLVLKGIPVLKETAQKALAKCTSDIGPLMTQAEAILVYDAGELLLNKCEESSLNLMKANLRIHKKNAVGQMLKPLFGIGGYFLVLLIGCGLIGKGRMSFPELIYCFQVRSSVLGGVFMLVSCMGNIRANSVCIKRVNSMLEQ